MSFKKFNEVAELLGMVAIVASLIFVGLQLRQSHHIAGGRKLKVSVRRARPVHV